ncbi:hypothetical protein EPVG_00428 [Emiliania huxleyi virus 201]|nr:hypothetical protein EQVG_00404 [Emiliania huxleyi virus 207]AEP16184.1 hypothetical protein ERVG_00309 [Emiliania huxleyi virus 208]AET98315.1 hypothetical protein EPVG_00428 [Emiliania huxleyi virus 201]
MSLGAGGFDDVTFSPDGNLVSEFLYMERLWRLASASDNYNDYTCSVKNIGPLMECLDITGPFTLSGSNLGNLIVSTGTIVSMDQTASIYDPDTNIFVQLLNGGANSSVSSLFGKQSDCADGSTGTIGDGIVGAFDIASLLWYQFSAKPFNMINRNPSQVTTVVGRVGTAERCNFNGTYNQETRVNWVTAVVNDYCTNAHFYANRIAPPAPPPVGRRQLAVIASDGLRLSPTSIIPGQYNMDVTVEEWLSTTNGRWFRISIDGVQITSELYITGIGQVTDVEFSAQAVPSQTCTFNCEPFPNSGYSLKPQVRFMRRMEYELYDYYYSLPDCANIQTIFSNNLAIYKNTVSLLQVPFTSACSYDTFIWVPGNNKNPCLLRGSHSQGTQFAFLTENICAYDNLIVASPPPPPNLPAVCECNLYYDEQNGLRQAATFTADTDAFFDIIETNDEWPFDRPVLDENRGNCKCNNTDYRPIWVVANDICFWYSTQTPEIQDKLLTNQPIRDAYNRSCTSGSAYIESYFHVRVCASSSVREELYYTVKEYCSPDALEIQNITNIRPRLARDGNLYCGTDIGPLDATVQNNDLGSCPCNVYYDKNALSLFSETAIESVNIFLALTSSEQSKWPVQPADIRGNECGCADANKSPVWLAPVDLCGYYQDAPNSLKDELIPPSPVYQELYKRSCVDISPEDQNKLFLHVKMCANNSFIQELFFEKHFCKEELVNGRLVPLLASDGVLLCASTVAESTDESTESESNQDFPIWAIALISVVGAMLLLCCCYCFVIRKRRNEQDRSMFV